MRIYRTLATVRDGVVLLDYRRDGTDEDVYELSIEYVDDPDTAKTWDEWGESSEWFKVEVEM